MNARDFLTLLLPSTGVYFIARPTAKGWHNAPHKTLDSALAQINKWTFEGDPAYFALASFEQEKYHDTHWKNKQGEMVGKWRSRTQANALFLKAFFLDFDVDPADPQKYPDKAAVLQSLKAFTQRVGLPRPLLVDSGGGIHAYWPLTMQVPAQEWKPVAELFKAVCLSEALHIDPMVPADSARVLRCLGSYNTRRQAVVKLIGEAGNLLSLADFAQRLEGFTAEHPVTVPRKHHAPQAQNNIWGDDGNLGATNDPGHFDRIAFACPQIGAQVALRGAGLSEPLWRAGLGVVKFCDKSDIAAYAISHGHAEYSPDSTRSKLDNWHASPTTCAHFHSLNPEVCERCPHWQAITSPIQLGKLMEAAPAPIVTVQVDADTTQQMTLPEPPPGYLRRKDGTIAMMTEDSEGRPVYTVVCPVDLYPISIDRQGGDALRPSENSQWRVHLPDGAGRVRIDDFEMECKLLANPRELYGFLLSRGLYMSDDQAKATGRYMSAYLKKMAQEAGRNQMFERLGWQDGYGAFTLQDRLLYRDGRSAMHKTPHSVTRITAGKPAYAGSLDGWKQAMHFYAAPGYEASRFFLYCAFGSPLLHMTSTGAKGALVLAVGPSGRGKSLTLRAASSIWGHPDAYIINGNKIGTTNNALYTAIGTMHSLPFLWDEITERSADDMREFLMNIDKGRDKLRLDHNSRISDLIRTWENISLGSANTDVSSLIAADGKNSDAHQRRLFTVEFELADTSANAKIKADQFLHALHTDYGHAGAAFMSAVLANYDAVRADCIRNLALIDSRLGATDASAARLWTAVAATAYTGAKVAKALGLIDYPVKQDLDWIIATLRMQTQFMADSRATAVDVLTSYLNTNLRNTLTISAKAASNLDNIDKEPMDRILVRNERDAGVIYVEVGSIRKYFLEVGRPYAYDRKMLLQQGIILDADARKTLGQDTRYANYGQSRCWKLDATKLSGLQPHQTPFGSPAQTNVVPLHGRTA